MTSANRLIVPPEAQSQRAMRPGFRVDSGMDKVLRIFLEDYRIPPAA
jgi:hypothetical protein